MKLIQITYIAFSFAVIANSIATASQKAPSSSVNYNARVYYKPTNVLDKKTKDSKIVGIYQRAQIGNDGAYGTFTKKGKTASQTVLEHNPTSKPASSISGSPLGYIQNTNPGGSSAYLELYAYTPPLTVKKTVSKKKRSMQMQKTKYVQKNP